MTRMRFSVASLIWFFGAVAVTAWACTPACAGPQFQQERAPLPPRLVSLAPSNTEIVYAIGADKQLVGVSDVCDYPPAAKAKLKVGSFVSAKVETITRLKPDAILLVSGQEALANTLTNRKLRVVLLKNEHLADISANVKELGRITGQTARAEKLCKSFDKALIQLSRIIARAKSQPRIFICVWPEPLITAGASSFIHEAVTACGGINIAASLPAAYPRMNVERLVTGRPEILVMAPQARQQDFWQRAPWSSTPAARNKQIFFLPEADKDPLSRPTLRIIEGLYWLSTILHPELKPELTAWKQSAAGELSLSLAKSDGY